MIKVRGEKGEGRKEERKEGGKRNRSNAPVRYQHARQKIVVAVEETEESKRVY